MKRVACCVALLATMPSAAGHAAPDASLDRALDVANGAAVHDWHAVNTVLFHGQATDLETLAMRAYVWGMPMVAAARIREAFTSPPPAGQGTPINRFVHRRKLAGPEMRVGVGPNNDTIYSLAWVDLRDGPMVLQAPDFGNRYYTFSINFADSSAQQSPGQRTHGGKLPPLFLHGPDWHGRVPTGMVDVPVATRMVNIAGRILVRGPQEYPLVASLQDRITLTRWADWQVGRQGSLPPVSHALALTEPDKAIPEGLQFLENLGRVLREWAVRPEDRGMVRQLRGLGISPGQGFSPDQVPATARERIIAGLELGRKLVQARSLHLGEQRNGWTINYRGPRFGDDFLLRAGVAKDQIFVAVPEEAVYPVGRVDAAGKPLDGSKCYAIRFDAAHLPPARAFWSITAYDDTGFMIPNALDRYSVGDRTPLVHGADGAITVWLGSRDPGKDAPVNWLPVTDARFYLMMRLYRPTASFLRREWTPPSIVQQPCSAK